MFKFSKKLLNNIQNRCEKFYGPGFNRFFAKPIWKSVPRHTPHPLHMYIHICYVWPQNTNSFVAVAISGASTVCFWSFMAIHLRRVFQKISCVSFWSGLSIFSKIKTHKILWELENYSDVQLKKQELVHAVKWHFLRRPCGLTSKPKQRLVEASKKVQWWKEIYIPSLHKPYWNRVILNKDYIP